MTCAGIHPALNGTNPKLVCQTNVESTDTFICNTCHDSKSPQRDGAGSVDKERLPVAMPEVQEGLRPSPL